MKRLLIVAVGLLLVLPASLYAAKTILDLTEDTSPSRTDMIETVEDPSGVPSSKKVELGNVLDLAVKDDAYSNAWDAETDTCPSRNAVYDKIETLGSSSGDVQSVGDCSSGACLDGTDDGGTYINLYDGAAYYVKLQTGTITASRTVSLPNGTCTLVGEGISSGGLLLGDSSPDSAGEFAYNTSGLQFYDTALRTVIHSGTTWTGGDLGGTGLAASVTDDSHNHTFATVSEVTAADMKSEDFGDFTCNGLAGGCSVDNDSHNHTFTTLADVTVADVAAADFGGFTCDGTTSCTVDSDTTWSGHNGYPSGCSAGNVVTAIGDTLTCTADDDTPDSDSEVPDAITVNGGTINNSPIGASAPASGAFTTLSGGSGGMTVDADGDTVAKSVTVTKVSGNAGNMGVYESYSTDTSSYGWRGPATTAAGDITDDLYFQFTKDAPSAQVMVFAAPSGSAPRVSAQTWGYYLGQYIDASEINTGAGAWDFGGTTTLEIPNSNDPDVSAVGQVSWDANGNWMRAYDGTNQVAIGRKQEEIHASAVDPQDWPDGTRDAFLIWSNESGMTFVVTGWKGWAGTDDTTLNLEETDADGQNNATVDAVEIATNGTGLFYASDGTITGPNIENGHLLWIDFDDADDPAWVKMTITGYYDANVN
jgi:hypothetical protein